MDATLKALRRHRLPAWWRDAKLGLFVHWTPASVPAFAPVDSDIDDLLSDARGDALAEIPYVEWYENSLRFPGSSVSRHHREVHGERPYRSFADAFRDGLSTWDPHDWARRFRAAGARYVVLVAKHHDGFCLWPSQVANPHLPGWHTGRDVVGELREAVLAEGMRFGLYYSAGLDWTFDDRPLGNLGDLLAAIPRGEYPAYADAQVRELIERYRPSVLWNDIAWPPTGPALWRLFADYYAAVPDGVVNDRWMPWAPVLGAARNRLVRRALDHLNARATRSAGGVVPPNPPHFDVRTPEYMVFDDVRDEPWECVRGMDRSFGFNRASRPEHFLSGDELVAMLADVVAKGGNLLLNVGPRGEDAAIPDEQRHLLEVLGKWTSTEGATIYGSSPWVVPAATTADGAEVRWWAAGERVFAAVAGSGGRRVVVPSLAGTPSTEVAAADGSPLSWSTVPGGIEVELPAGTSRPVVRFEHVVAAPER